MFNKDVSWYLIENFDPKRHLFHDKIITGYQTISYICSCGEISIQLLPTHLKYEDLEYSCPSCGNKKFFNTNFALQNFEYFFGVNNIELNCKYKTFLENEEFKACYVLSIPSNIDFLRKKVTFSDMPLFAKTLNAEGIESFKYEINPSDGSFNYSKLHNIPTTLSEIEKELQIRLLRDVLNNNIFDIQRVNGYQHITYLQLLFFLENPLINNIYLYKDSSLNSYNYLSKEPLKPSELENIVKSFNRGKSVTKAIYQSYNTQINIKSYFIINFILAFNLSMKDNNVLKKLISLNLEKQYIAPYKSLYKLIIFLKSFYKEVQIYNFFKSLVPEESSFLFYDVLSMYKFLEDNKAFRNFVKVKCKLKPIHDEFTRLYNLAIEQNFNDTIFSYTKEEKKAAVRFSNYEIKLPQKGVELKEWGNSLGNCLITYAPHIDAKTSTVYAFFLYKKIEFVVEVKKGKIIQRSAYSNNPLNKKQELILKEWKIQYLNNNISKPTYIIPVEIS